MTFLNCTSELSAKILKVKGERKGTLLRHTAFLKYLSLNYTIITTCNFDKEYSLDYYCPAYQLVIVYPQRFPNPIFTYCLQADKRKHVTKSYHLKAILVAVHCWK